MIIARIASGDEDAIAELAASASEQRRVPDRAEETIERPHHLRTIGRGFVFPERGTHG